MPDRTTGQQLVVHGAGGDLRLRRQPVHVLGRAMAMQRVPVDATERGRELQ
jgi:hypothetical protein